ncbi:MAG TPA: hypothetical protein VE621_13335 [Bryobacteraceae bacterium]|nr:hypothetical protein [Bryobacteraceae bacterium]
MKIKINPEPRIAAVAPKMAEITDLFAALMTPASLLAFVFGAWRLAADLGFAGQFAIDTGVFSHWMVWMAIGCLIQVIGVSVRSRTVPVPSWLKQPR